MSILAAFVVVVLALFAGPVQNAARAVLHRRPPVIFLAPPLLTAAFCAAAGSVLSLPLATLVAVYTLLPTTCAYIAGTKNPGAQWLDLAAILLLWMPMELGAGASLVPKDAQGTLHAVAYGVAVTLALILFLLFRSLPGMKYNLPRRWTDLRNALAGYAIAFAVLMPLGRWPGFLAPLHAPHRSLVSVLPRLLAIFLGTALPEEILFRALIQNWLEQRLGRSNWTIVLAGAIFGCAHLDNGPGALPNWRYAIVATGAGIILGKVFDLSGSIVASALVHTGVDATKWLLF
jgi:membrane protease YdiL (CAAX protease family)